MCRKACFALAVLVLMAGNVAALDLIKEDWDYVAPMKEVARKFNGTQGVVIHIGDSITYANPYGQWARYGKGQTDSDKAVLKWMHAGEKNNLDGWHLASVDRPGGRSDTAVGGIRIDEFLKGGKSGIPPLKDLVTKYNPQLIVLMLGTNDLSANRPVEKYKADMEQAVKLILQNGTVLILSTLPPHPNRQELGKGYNAVLRELGKKYGLPMIDYGGHILQLRPTDWNGTLLGKNDVHPSHAGLSAAEPTEDNLKSGGYLLRGWLSVQKIREVKEKVFDPISKEK